MNIEIKDLSKSFGEQQVLKDVSFVMSSGTVYGLIGRNGAGKTTLINILINLVRPNAGKIFYEGEAFSSLSTKLKKRIGILAEENPIIEELTIQQYLTLIGKLYGLDSEIIESRQKKLIAWFFDESEKVNNKRMSGFSTGMKKKAGLIAAILHKPDFLILDEPFSGLDPVSAQQCVDFIKSYKNKKRTIILSSHNINYIEEIADQIVVLNNGTIEFNESLKGAVESKTGELKDILMDILQYRKRNDIKPGWI